MRRILFMFCIWCSLSAQPAKADDVFRSVPGDLRYSKEVPIAQKVIVWDSSADDKGSILRVCYYRLDSQRRRFVTNCRTREGQEVFRVETSPASERQQLLDAIFKAGARATVTDSKGKVVELYSLVVDFDAPRGYRRLDENDGRDKVPEVRLNLVASGKTEYIEFSNVNSVRFEGDGATVLLRDGKQMKGKWVGETTYAGESPVLLLGLDAAGKRVTVKLDDVFQIEFR